MTSSDHIPAKNIEATAATASRRKVVQPDGRDESSRPVTVTHLTGKPSSAEEWDHVIANSRDTWLYHRSGVVSVFTLSGSMPPVFVECRLSGKLVGGAILSAKVEPWHGSLKRKTMYGAFGPSWTSPFVVSGIEPRMVETIFETIVEACIDISKKDGCEELVLSDSNPSLRCLEDRPTVNRYVTSTDWKHSCSYFWLLDLRPDTQTLWKNMASSHQRQIKKAQAQLQVVCGRELPQGLDAIRDLMEAVHRRENVVLAPFESLLRLWDTVLGTDSGETFFCLDDEKPCAVAVVTRLGNTASYLYGGRADDAMNGAAILALWSGIEWAKSVGCEWFDLNSMIPERDRARLRGISEFKKRFGGQIIAAHGARIELARLKKTTCTFINAWGAATKGALRSLLGGRKAPSATSGLSDEPLSSVVEVSMENGRPKPVEAKWEITRRSPGPTSPDEWDAAVRDSRETWLYHLSRLAPLLLPPAADPLTFLELRLDGKLVGGAIFEIQRYRWHGLWDQKYLRGLIGPQTVAPFLTNGLPAKLAETAWDRLLEGCMAAAREKGCLGLTLWDSVQSPRVIDDRETVNRYSSMSGWSPLLAHHYFLDLSQDLDALFKNVQSRRRTYIRRAKEQLRVVTGREFYAGRDAHIALMEAVFQREGRVVIPSDQLRQIYELVYDGEHGEAIFCLQDGKPITFTGVARFRDVASYLHGGRFDETQHGAHALGFWSGVEWAKAAGCRWFDCNAATFEKRGRERMRTISEFKRGFGGFLIQVHGAKRRFHPLAFATYEFIDAWGVLGKQLLCKANPFRR